MKTAAPVLRILSARSMLLRRWIVEHAFILFVLGPILVGCVLWTTEQYLHTGRELLAQRLAADAGVSAASLFAALLPAPGLVGWTLALLLALTQWPGSLREAFGARPGEDLLDALPVTEAARFLSVVGIALSRAVAPAGLLLAAAVALRSSAGPLTGGDVAIWAGDLLLAAIVLTCLDLTLAYVLARVGWLSGGRLLALGTGAVVAASVPVLRPMLIPLWLPACLMESVMARSLEISVGVPSHVRGLAALEVVILLLIAGALSLRYRRRDLERVARIVRPRRRWTRLPLPGAFERLVETKLGGAVTASLRRDLRLVLRRFSPAVPLALAVALVAAALVVRLVTDGAVVPEWRAELLVLGFLVAVLAVVSIVPFLLAAQLPQMWIERSTGVSPQQVWWGKALLAVLLALVPLAAGCALLLLLLPLGESWLAVFQLVCGGGVVAAMVGASVFEIAEEPRLGLILASFPGLALACLILLYPVATVLWLAGAGWAVGEMVKRSARRIRFTDVPR